MDRYSCIFYTTISGRSPVEDFVGSLSADYRKVYFQERAA